VRPKRPHVAALNEVEITRQTDTAIVRFLDPEVGTTHLQIGPAMRSMTDAEILARFNECIMAQEASRRSYHHVAVEVPPGRPQIRYSSDCDQWVPRGFVLRCLIHDDAACQAVIEIDGRELSLSEFGRTLVTFAGWGMRICFVPDDEIDKEPEIEIREPDDD
jgi:hypothetical protein